MTKQLTTQNATITTAAVQVKTLTISGKQVTLAVFRQLREEPLIADDGTLNGVPWGFVNYHPDKCGESGFRHWHIVWQRGEELLRARVDKEPSFDRWHSDDREFWPDVAGAYVEAWVREWLHGRVTNEPLHRHPKGHGYGRFLAERKFNHDGLIVGADVGTAAVDAANAKLALDGKRESLEAHPDWDWLQKDLQKAETQARETLAALDAEIDSWNSSLAEVQADYQRAVTEEAERRQRHRNLRTTLAELPQLFIAV